MNHIFRTIWNANTGHVVAVCELAGTGGRRASGTTGAVARCGAGNALKAALAVLLLPIAAPSYALPTDGVVVAGEAGISTHAGGMTITQGSQNAQLNWQGFSIGPAETVQFLQPDSSSVALNRVLGTDPSSILGNLSANGKVFLVNPNGILFGQGASVTVGGLVASTLDITDSDFAAGQYSFAGTSRASVINHGAINAGGYVALLGAKVLNHGVIAARLGTVALAAGEAITIDVAGDGLLNVGVDQGAIEALVANGGMIQADGGQVLLSAQSAGNLLHTAVNNTGVIQAQTIESRDGVIRLLGDMQSGTVSVGGTLDASAPTDGHGGFIDTSAASVRVAEGARITTAAAQGQAGSWLIDPSDYTIAASGGDITGAALSASLAHTNIIIQSSAGSAGIAGDIHVRDALAWSANRLTLQAQDSIHINAGMAASGTASLALEFGLGALAAGNASAVNVRSAIDLPAGESFSTKQGSDGLVNTYVVITSLGAAGSISGTDLQGIGGNLLRNYALGSDIDAAATRTWNDGMGFAPIGDEMTAFNGAFAGLGHTITGLTIDRPNSGSSGLALFAHIGPQGSVSDVGLEGGSVTGNNSNFIAPLVALNHGTISNSYANASATGSSIVGGLLAFNYGTVRNSYATGTVTAGGDNAGGLSAYNYGLVTNSHATGHVSAASYFSGGLIGSNLGVVTNSYATAVVTGNNVVGGLVAFNQFGSSLSNSYASGPVSGNESVGGLMGHNNTSITASYWDSSVNAVGVGSGSATGATGLGTAQMQTAASFAGFNFTTLPGATGNAWVLVDMDGTLNNAGGAAGATRPMLASEYSTTLRNARQLQLMSMDLDASYTLGNDINAAATGGSNDVFGSGTFIPVGNATTAFTGSLDGKGHAVSNLTVSLPGHDNVGLFGITSAGSSLRNVGLEDVSVAGYSNVGALAGSHGGSISNSYAGGTASGGGIIGGLVGLSGPDSSIRHSYADTVVYADHSVAGGLVGSAAEGASISNSYATGAVTAVDGLVGGLLGFREGASISQSYATGTVAGNLFAGGLVGFSTDSAANTTSGSFWDITTSGQASSAGGIGMTTAQMRMQANFTTATAANGNANPAWDLSSDWIVYEGHTSPLLRTFMTALTVTANDASKTYDGLEYAGASGVTYSTVPDDNLFGAVTYDSGVNAGASTITPGGLYSNQRGYAIDYVGGALTVAQANLTISTSDVNKVYDGSAVATGTATVTAGTLFGSDAISGGSFAFKDQNAGAGNRTVTVADVTIADGNAGGNYNVTYVDNTTSTISQVVLTAAATAEDKVYDGTLAATTTLVITSGLIGNETINAVGAAAFNSKDVLSANLVTVNSVVLTDGTGQAGNYTLAAGQTAVAAIVPRHLTIEGMRAADRVYDGSNVASLSGGSLNGMVDGETLLFSGQSAAFADSNVGTGKAVSVSGLVLADGNSAASNYTLGSPSGLTADVTRLASVSWVGGAAGDWFDPANWAGGATPDLANVATVFIPAGVMVNFHDRSVPAPAQAGAVQLDALEGAGSMHVAEGRLEVANDLQLSNLEQSGGTLGIGGDVRLGSLRQSSGSLQATGQLIVRSAYAQTAGAATVDAGGDIIITQAADSILLGNISTAANLAVTAMDGDITQLADTRITVAGTSTLSAPNGTVALQGSGNSPGAPVVTGAGVTRLQNARTAPASSVDVAPGTPDPGLRISPAQAGRPMASLWPGLGVTVIGSGLRLPAGVGPGETDEHAD